MREVTGGHASTSNNSPPSLEMEATDKPSERLLEESDQSNSFLTNAHAIAAPHDAGKRNELDKRGLNYVLRSGLAGGIAGCAVGQYVMKTIGTH